MISQFKSLMVELTLLTADKLKCEKIAESLEDWLKAQMATNLISMRKKNIRYANSNRRRAVFGTDLDMISYDLEWDTQLFYGPTSISIVKNIDANQYVISTVDYFTPSGDQISYLVHQDNYTGELEYDPFVVHHADVDTFIHDIYDENADDDYLVPDIISGEDTVVHIIGMVSYYNNPNGPIWTNEMNYRFLYEDNSTDIDML